MTNVKRFISHPLLLLLAACLSAASLLGGIFTLTYNSIHALDCESSSARKHPRCTSGTLLLLNGHIRSRGSSGEVEALAVQGGRIVAAGTSSLLKSRYPNAEKTDLSGYYAYPAFIDSRVWLLDGGLGLARFELTGSSREKLREELQSAVKRFSDASWLIGQGWTLDSLGGKPVLKYALDSLNTERPIFLWRRDFGAAILNSRALDLLNIDRSTPDLPNGRIDRNRTRTPTGLLEGQAAYDAFARVVSTLPGPEIKKALLAAQEAFLSHGVTRVSSIQNHGLQELVAIGELIEAGAWRLRVRAVPELGETHWRYGLYRSSLPETLSVGGAYAELDGRIEQRNAAFTLPYPDGSPRMPPTWDAGELARALRDLDEPGAILQVTGDRALELSLEAMAMEEELHPLLLSSLLWSEEAIRKAARHDAVAMFSPTRLARDWQDLRPHIPPRTVKNAININRLVGRRLHLALASDWPRGPLDPFAQIRLVTRAALPRGTSPLPQLSGDGLSLADAIAGLTSNPARQAGLRQEGSLEVGMAADMVVLDEALGSWNDSAPAPQAVMTILGGEVVWRREGGLQFRVREEALAPSPSGYKVLARQHFLKLLLVLFFLLWPVTAASVWTWKHRPRPKPPEVIFAVQELGLKRGRPSRREQDSRRGRPSRREPGSRLERPSRREPGSRLERPSRRELGSRGERESRRELGSRLERPSRREPGSRLGKPSEKRPQSSRGNPRRRK